jgi:hypothetical protein
MGARSKGRVRFYRLLKRETTVNRLKKLFKSIEKVHCEYAKNPSEQSMGSVKWAKLVKRGVDYHRAFLLLAQSLGAKDVPICSTCEPVVTITLE